MTEEERRWWNRLQKILQGMPENLVVLVSATGGVTAHRRVSETMDNELDALASMPKEYRIYSDCERMR